MISIVSAYYNRKPQFYRTLKSISNSKVKDFEYIVVDDGSSDEHRLEDLVKEFPFLKIIRIEPKDKWYVNSCIPFNIGIRNISGDIIILQNPECLHVHDVLSYAKKYVNDDNYVTFSAYAINEKLTNFDLLNHIQANTVPQFLKGLPQKITDDATYTGWYNHTKYRPAYYHFCSTITKKNMDLLNGFDERYADGIACDDDEFVVRIGRLGLKKIIVDDVSVIHQWHAPSYYVIPNARQLREKNGLLLNITRIETGYRAINNLTII